MNPHRKALTRALICLWLGATLSGCVQKPPALPASASRVQNGQLYQSGQSEFDGLFRELHDLQQALANAPEEERQIRRALASALSVDDGATRPMLTDKVSERAQALGAKKIRIKLETEGLDADDEADTMAQAKVVGTLDAESQKFVESVALATRQELKLAARLRRAQKRLEHLAHHAAALDPWVDSTFGGLGPAKLAEVRQNLEDARRQFPLLTVRATELADEARRTAHRLSNTMTTDVSLGSSKEPPLIAPVDAPSVPRARPRAPASNVAPKKPAAPAKPQDSGAADFEP